MVGKMFDMAQREIAEDPVCHMKVDKKKPNGGTHVHKDVTYYFCGNGCRVAFSKDPESYLSGKKKIDM